MYRTAHARYSRTDAQTHAQTGWLDNAGSFDALAPYFVARGFTFLALDPPGCGHSDHRASHESYNDFDEVPLIADVLDYVGWKAPIVLVAHSRGGAVGATFAGAFPDRVKAAVFFDSSLGLTGLYPSQEYTTAPERLQQARESDLSNQQRTVRIFTDVNSAVRHSLENPFFPKALHTARAIVERHLTPCDGGYTFRHDVRTYGQKQNLHIDEAQMREFLAALACPVLRVNATARIVELPEAYEARVQARLAVIKDLTNIDVEGKHHVHSDEPAACAAVVFEWLDQRLYSGTAVRLGGTPSRL
jgi:pimeloyl-ACP methyl ester carboxylesterase